MLEEAGYKATLMVDCSHSNSLREPTRQEKVLRSLVRQRKEGQAAIIGFMLESNLQEGSQPMAAPADLKYGISITDPCMVWEQTEEVLRWAHQELR